MKLNIRTKLIGGFVAALVLLVAISTVTFFNTNNLADNSAMIAHTHEVLAELEGIVSLLKDAEIGQRGYLITGEDRYQEPYVAALPQIQEKLDHVRQLTSDNPRQQDRLNDLEPLVQAKLDELQETIDLRTTVGFDAALAVVLTDAGNQVMDELRGVIGQMEQEEADLLVMRASATDSAAKSTRTVILFGTAIAILVLGAIAWFLSRSISTGVASVSNGLKRISVGDLTEQISVQSSDEIGDMGRAYVEMRNYLREASQVAERIGEGDLMMTVNPRSEQDALGNAFSQMVANLRGLVGQVRGTADNLSRASDHLASSAEEAGRATEEIANSSQHVSDGARQQYQVSMNIDEGMTQLSNAIEQVAGGSQEQASSVDQASNIVAQVSKATSEVASSAQSAADGARQANEAAREGFDMVGKTVEGMERIKVAVDDASQKIRELGDQSAEIGKIVAVIDDIAAQTNLLALNAAIEAARAGEQGRGFAVVADELRTLAERVTEATKEIANLIEVVQKGVAESVKATEEGSKEVAEGSQLAEEAGKTLSQILSSVEAVAEQIEQISAASEEVSAASDEMVKTVESVSGVTEQNSAATEQMADNSIQVSQAVDNISGIIEQNSAVILEMSESTQEVAAQIQEVVASSQELDQMAKELQEVVGKFNTADSGS